MLTRHVHATRPVGSDYVTTHAHTYHTHAPFPLRKTRSRQRHGDGLYTILPSPIVYGIWHTKGGSVGGRILRNRRAIVLQQDGLYKWGGQ